MSENSDAMEPIEPVKPVKPVASPAAATVGGAIAAPDPPSTTGGQMSR